MGFVSRLAAPLAVCILLCPAMATAQTRAYIGSYTPEPTARAENHGEGIYFTEINPATGTPSAPRLVARALSPSWLDFSPDHRFLYASSEILTHEGRSGGLVTAYAVEANGNLRQLNVVSSGGASPAYISVHPSGRFVMLANYYGGSFSIIRIRPDGGLGEMTDLIQLPSAPDVKAPVPTGPAPGAQFVGPPPAGHPRGHMVGTDPSGQFVIGNDTGRHNIIVWRLNTTTGKLTEVSRILSEPGSGPRHFVFSADGKIMYQLQEQNARLASYDFNNGVLKLRQAPVSTLPPGFTGTVSTAELLISNDGKFLYSSNRGPDTIAVWSLDAKGMFTRIADVSTEGRTPRSLTLDPSGRYLYAMNQRSNGLAVFRIDPATGIPRFTVSVPVNTPSRMIFLPH